MKFRSLLQVVDMLQQADKWELEKSAMFLTVYYQTLAKLIWYFNQSISSQRDHLNSNPSHTLPLLIHTSSVIIKSISTLAWMKSKSVLRLTVPLIPIKQCSFVCWNIAFGSRNFTFPGFFLFVLIQQMSSQRRNPHFRRHWKENGGRIRPCLHEGSPGRGRATCLEPPTY